MKILLETAHLDAPCSLERGQSMSTLIASEEWVLETNLDEASGVIGDIRLYRNQDASQNKTDNTGPEPVVTRPKGPYWGSIPAARVKCYRFLNGEPHAAGPKGRT